MPKGKVTDVLIKESEVAAKRNMKGKSKTLFTSDLKQMMYGFGDERVPLQESLELMDEMVQEYITEMCAAAVRRRAAVSNSKATLSDLVSLLGTDNKKYGRAVELLVRSKIIEKAKQKAEPKMH